MASWMAWIFLMFIIFNGQESNAQDCGMATLNPKIVGGENATAGSWPWQVSIHYNPRRYHFCGGTLINSRWVLTAAHCMRIVNASDLTLYMGRETQNGSNPNEVSSNVSQIIIHPQYNNTLFNNDIALMKLSSPVNFTNYIKPICLASNSSLFHNSTFCWSTGFGRTEYGGKPSQTLLEVEVPVIGTKQCTCKFAAIPQTTLTDQMICAGPENKGACQGDSGGPLQCKQGPMWIQAGITSYGVVPCGTSYPDVYVRVSEFQTWITDHLVGENVSFVTFTSRGTDPDSSFICPNTNLTTPSNSSTSATHVQLSLFGLTLTMLLGDVLL